MKKYILLITFLTGILLVGVGTGIAYGEYSSFSYGGDVVFGEENRKEETLECYIPVEDKKTVLKDFLAGYDYNDWDEMTVAEDPTLLYGQVQVEVVYNPDFIRPELEFRKYSEEDTYAGEVVIQKYRTMSDFEWFLMCKDDFIEKVKNKTISNYDINVIDRVTVKANKETLAFLEK